MPRCLLLPGDASLAGFSVTAQLMRRPESSCCRPAAQQGNASLKILVVRFSIFY
jgi:hypothetical protein